MIALYRDSLTDEPRAIQRTFLTREARKIGRAMLGPVKGCAIKIDRLPTGGACLGIAEGFASALSGRAFGYTPAWAVGSAGAIASFPAIPSIRHLVILAENDANGANERAVADCRDRWNGTRITRIKVPEGQNDLNDVWMQLPQAPLEERAEVFEGICNRFWPGASVVTTHESEGVLATLKRIGYPPFCGDQD